MIKYTLSKEYQFIIIPMILLLLTLGAYLVAKTSLLIGAPSLIVCGSVWFLFLRSAHTINVKEESVEIISLLKRIIIKPTDILSIEDHYYYHQVYHRNGAFYLVNLISQLPSLINTLKSFSQEKKIEHRYEGGLLKPNKKISWFHKILIWSLIISGIAAARSLFV